VHVGGRSHQPPHAAGVPEDAAHVQRCELVATTALEVRAVLNERRGERLMREAISEVISEGTSEAIRGHQRGHQRSSRTSSPRWHAM